MSERKAKLPDLLRALVITGLATLSAPIYAQSLTIGVANLQLGMTPETALPLLNRYIVRCNNQDQEIKNPRDCADWYVLTKDGPPFHMLGNLYFRKGRLIHISKHWIEDEWDRNPAAFIALLHDILRGYEQQFGSLQVTTTEQSYAGPMTTKSIRFKSGRYEVQVTYIDGARVDGKRLPASVSMQESVH